MRRLASPLAFAALLLATTAHAQPRVFDVTSPLVFDTQMRPQTLRPAPPLAPALLARLQVAQRLHRQNLLGAARDTLTRLLADVPHHPTVLAELARVTLEQSDWAATRKLGVDERAATRDSILLAHELAEAYERLGQPTDAARVAIEAWAATPYESDWATQTLLRLTPADGRVVRDGLRRAVVAAPGRADLARGLARFEWRAGDAKAMVRALADADHHGARMPQRWSFAEELARSGVSRDTTGALETLLDLSADPTIAAGIRGAAAQRGWELAGASSRQREFAPRLATALRDLKPDQWEGTLQLELARVLRESGRTADVRELLGAQGATPGAAPSTAPALAVERALVDLREGPPERALPALRAAAESGDEAAFRYAEALFFAGQVDSAAAWYQRVSADAEGPNTGAAFERLYLIEDAEPKTALPAFGRAAYAAWRGDVARAVALTDSLYHALPRGPLWAHAALDLSAGRADAGDFPRALEPLLAVADSLPADRLAPLARQKAGEIYHGRLKDDARAIAQYEECLARYPRAWNAAEVRRRLEQLRRDRRL